MIQIKKSVERLKFVDLFAGLGGFHLALKEFGHSCVFACDIDQELRESYYKNFGLMPEGDIRKVSLDSIPSHDILCAGFPCQPFSKAGFQAGLKDKERGTLFSEIIRIIKSHKPKYILLENVPNIKRHNNSRTWKKIVKLLCREGYDISSRELSPHHFGIPQIRLRTYIVGVRGELNGFKWPEPNGNSSIHSVLSILDKNPPDAKKLSPQINECLNVWQEFLALIPNNEKIPHPLWAMEFGATYPYETTTPYKISAKELKKYKGSFGQHIYGERKKEMFKYLPSHATRHDLRFPKWKVNMIQRNRKFYDSNRKILEPWIKKIKKFPSSFQKLEWNVGDEPRLINKYIVQCRASGVRVKRLTTAPSLVAMNHSQIPIIPWEGRYMTAQECMRLQSMEKLKILPKHISRIHAALGNAINVRVVKLIAHSLLHNGVENNGKGTTSN